jgi:hypothetical protein
MYQSGMFNWLSVKIQVIIHHHYRQRCRHTFEVIVNLVSLQDVVRTTSQHIGPKSRVVRPRRVNYTT